ncbi:MAG: 2-hydroxychromene-2-carboxylate isomerase [Burkholderiales bacterium]|nr:2-hydroxychromene-2-carboxylate isomerase [Burkholderiales bacterium]
MRTIRWYFDFVSPFSYIALLRLPEVAADIEYRPVLFAGLLAHWGQKGPAELPTKRLWTYRYCQWLADALDIPFRFPAQHPFNPLHHLRLAIAAGATPLVVRRIFEAIWTTGADAADATGFESLCRELRIEPDALVAPAVKDALRANTEQAARRGIFGVPTFEVGGELFWGVDGIDFLKAYLEDPAILQSDQMRRFATLPVGAQRKA